MESKDKIEKIAREAFENYEEPVSQGLWDKISQQLPQGSPSQGGHDGGASSSAGSSTAGNVITASKGLSAGIWGGAAIVAVTATTLYFVNSGDEPAAVTQQQLAGTEIPADENVDVNEDNTIAFEEAEKNNSFDERLQEANSDQPASTNNRRSTPGVTENDLVPDDQGKKTSVTEHPVKKQDQTITSGTNTDSPGAIAKNNTDGPKAEQTGKPANVNSESNPKGESPEQVTEAATIRYELFASPAEGVAPLEVTLTLKAYSGEVTWDFGDGASGFGGPSISHQYEIPGTYTAWAKFTDETGFQHAEPVIVKVEADDFLKNFIPNVFTPNGDGTNDVFTIRSEQLTECEVTIYDRQGRQVARFLDPEIGWDGTLEGGTLAPEGTYFYVIIAKGKEGQAHNYKGTLKLIR